VRLLHFLDCDGPNYAGCDGKITTVSDSWFIVALWEGSTNEPKTKRSKATVPVIPLLRGILGCHRIAYGRPSKGAMFAHGKGEPANLNNTLNREILPALNRCELWRKSKAEHAGVSHEFK
jgi:hypothetical protein